MARPRSGIVSKTSLPHIQETLPVHETVTAFAPATVANLGVGFDIFGMALDAPGDVVRATYHAQPGARLGRITGDDGRLPRAEARNTACIAAQLVLERLHASGGVTLDLDKGLPLASGLGSSAASAAAAAVAVNALFGAPLPLADLLLACIEAEASVSGRHADNAAPALWGGIVLVVSTESWAIHPLPVPDNLYLALVTPDIAVPTAHARAVLPARVSMHDMVRQTALVAALVHALHTGDLALLARTAQQDPIVTPARAKLIPGFEQACAAATEAGALATLISGSGPTLCALCADSTIAAAAAGAFTATYDRLGIGSRAFTARPSQRGARTVP